MFKSNSSCKDVVLSISNLTTFCLKVLRPTFLKRPIEIPAKAMMPMCSTTNNHIQNFMKQHASYHKLQPRQNRRPCGSVRMNEMVAEGAELLIRCLLIYYLLSHVLNHVSLQASPGPIGSSPWRPGCSFALRAGPVSTIPSSKEGSTKPLRVLSISILI